MLKNFSFYLSYIDRCFRAWKQKIEAWLQENEKEENESSASEEIRRRNRKNLSVNRRSLEGDSGTCVPACVRVFVCL